jgi:hypothetical protein
LELPELEQAVHAVIGSWSVRWIALAIARVYGIPRVRQRTVDLAGHIDDPG